MAMRTVPSVFGQLLTCNGGSSNWALDINYH